MSVSLALPPSGRDLVIYQRVIVENDSTRAVAGEFQLSQTRVRQIVERVNLWLSATLPKSDPDIDDAAKIRVGQQVAADRMEYLYGNAMEQWRQSKQPKFAGLAIRIITAQAKVPAFPGTIAALAADAIEGPLQDESSTLARSASGGNALSTPSAAADRNVSLTSSPPARDCSPMPTSRASKAAQAKPISVANSVVAEPCGKLPPSAANARQAFFAPAHPTETLGDDSSVTELKITPDQLGFSTRRLSRRDRRRLRRKLGA